jgi:signal transduction histidine kinase
MGLGLSIAYNIMEKHHGKICVVSELGHGCEFILTLPKQL